MIGYLILLVFGLLNVILFFKILGMCNDVSRIHAMLYDRFYGEKEKASALESNKFKVGDKVVILKSGKVTTVVGIEGDKVECKSENGDSYCGVFNSSELNKF